MEAGHRQSLVSSAKAPEDINPRHILLDPTALAASMPRADRSLAGYISQAGAQASPTSVETPAQAPALQHTSSPGLVRVEQHADATANMPSQNTQSRGFPPALAPITAQPGRYEDGQMQNSRGTDLDRPAAPAQNQAVPDDMTVIPLDEGHQHTKRTYDDHAQPRGVAASAVGQGEVRAATTAPPSHAGVQLGAARGFSGMAPASQPQSTTTAVGPHPQGTITAGTERPAILVGQAAGANLEEEAHSRPSWTQDAFHAAARVTTSQSPWPRHLQDLPERPTSSEGVAGTSEDEVRHLWGCTGL